MTIKRLDQEGVLLHWSKPDGPSDNPERHRWYYHEGTLYECIKPWGQGHWSIYEIGMARTGQEWDEPPGADQPAAVSGACRTQ